MSSGRRLTQATRGFLGRADELALAARLFAAGERLLVFRGVPGVGKSRLARVFAGTLAEGGATVRSVSLADGRDRDGILGELARAAGLHARTADARVLLDRLVARLERDRAVVVIDDVAGTLAPLATLLEDLLDATDEVGFVVASEVRLEAPSAFHIPVAPLPPRDAAALLLDRVARRAPALVIPPAVADRLARACGGLPLAIDLVATRVATLGAADVEVALGDGDLGLDALDRAMDRAAAALSAPAHGALLRLSVFRGDFDGTEAAALVFPEAPRTEALGQPPIAAVLDESSSEGGITITEAEMPACFADVKAREGARLPFFTTTNAANDIGVLISRTHEKIPGTDTPQPAFVMGISYGTFWAHRYLQLYPNQPAGIIFDSVAPQGASLARQDADSDEAAKDFLAACGADTFCSSKLGAGLAPWDKAQALFAKLKTGHCAEIAVSAAPTHVLFRRAFASMLMQPQLRTYIPAVIHRADRCSAADITSLKFFMKAISQPAPEDEMMRQWGWMLSYNVIFSEMWETPEPAPGELAGIRDRAIASRDITAMMEAALPLWSRYPADPLATSWATSDKPLLFLNGGLDPATLLRKARLAKPHFTKPNQHWVEVPTASHTVIGSSPLPEGGSCGTRMFMSFMEDPTAPLDTSCVAKVVPLDFTNTVDRDLTRGLFGRYDAWE